SDGSMPSEGNTGSHRPVTAEKQKEVFCNEQTGSYGQGCPQREGHRLPRSPGRSADRSHQRAERAPEEEPQRSPQPPRLAQDGRPPPQSAGLPAEEGCGALPRPDRYAGSAQVISMNEGQAPCYGCLPFAFAWIQGGAEASERPGGGVSDALRGIDRKSVV